MITPENHISMGGEGNKNTIQFERKFNTAKAPFLREHDNSGEKAPN